MAAESPALLVLADESHFYNHSETYNVLPHIVDLEKPFVDQLSEVNDRIETSLRMGREVVLLGMKDTGILAVAALVKQPQVSEVVTLWSAFRDGVTPFEREGIRWLNKYSDSLTAPLKSKITTVYTHNGFSGFQSKLRGVKVAKVRYNDADVKTWRDGFDRLMEEPLNVYFKKRYSILQNFPHRHPK
ncbi:MAG TPA: hypothetical protein VLF93_06115 [Candidatus Saccharimonadales bacterium]|nr:hypothetical protein [Candidatus Saccharimonadales bacterium]